MFLCVQEARETYPSALLPDGGGYWSVVFRELVTPWFIVTFDEKEDGFTFPQTALISDPHRLKEIFEDDGIARFSKVQWMTYDRTTGAWLSREIDEVWLQNRDKVQDSGRLVIHDPEKGYLLTNGDGGNLEAPEVTSDQWTLLYGPSRCC
jgi:hypothetical protein